MEKRTDYLVAKLKWSTDGKGIESFFVYPYPNGLLGDGVERPRNWVVQKMNSGKTFRAAVKKKNGNWEQGNPISFNKSFKGVSGLPLIRTKRKIFISYYHKDDQKIKKSFKNLTDDLFVNKSVIDGAINTDFSDEYIKQLIQKKYLYDTTVLVVLIGPKTKCRKHVDWEISGALNHNVGGLYAGVLGLILPSHPDYRKSKSTYTLLPKRLADNFESGYATIHDYTSDRKKLQEYVEEAFKSRRSKSEKRRNSSPQLGKNLCD